MPGNARKTTDHAFKELTPVRNGNECNATRKRYRERIDSQNRRTHIFAIAPRITRSSHSPRPQISGTSKNLLSFLNLPFDCFAPFLAGLATPLPFAPVSFMMIGSTSSTCLLPSK